MTVFAYVGDHSVIDQHPELYGRECEIVGVEPDPTDPDPTNDRYVIRFAEGARQITVYPEELNPIPAPGTAR